MLGSLIHEPGDESESESSDVAALTQGRTDEASAQIPESGDDMSGIGRVAGARQRPPAPRPIPVAVSNSGVRAGSSHEIVEQAVDAQKQAVRIGVGAGKIACGLSSLGSSGLQPGIRSIALYSA